MDEKKAEFGAPKPVDQKELLEAVKVLIKDCAKRMEASAEFLVTKEPDKTPHELFWQIHRRFPAPAFDEAVLERRRKEIGKKGGELMSVWVRLGGGLKQVPVGFTAFEVYASVRDLMGWPEEFEPEAGKALEEFMLKNGDLLKP